MVNSFRVCAIAALAASSAPFPAAAAQEAFVAEYAVSLYGMTIAKARFESAFDAQGFSIDGNLSSAGIARIFDRTTGTTSVRGAIRRDGEASPRSYRVDYVTGRKQKSTAISFSSDAVSQTRNVPEPTERSERWVHVTPSHLRSVFDPISSTLVPAQDAGQVCNRTIRIYDGEMRADLRLSEAERDPGAGTVTCSARFEPVAGYRQGQQQIDYLRDRGRISITFAPLGSTGFYTPVDASIGTQIGTVRIRAVRLAAR